MFSSDHFRQIVQLAAIAWMAGVALSLLVGASGVTELSIGQIARISAASGFLGLVAILPFSSKAVRRLGGGSVAEVLSSQVGLFVAFSIGMGIRIAGTVALFLACRYQMVATDGEIAAFVLAWYLYLTLIEIALVLYQSRRHLICEDNGVKASCSPDVIESCSKV